MLREVNYAVSVGEYSEMQRNLERLGVVGGEHVVSLTLVPERLAASVW
jgi:hypothetical protein